MPHTDGVFIRLLLCALLSVASWSATITTSAYCYTDSLSVSGPDSCNLISPRNGRATANLYPTTITFGGTIFKAEIGVDVFTVQSPPDSPNSVIGGSSEALAMSGLSLDLMTFGDPRPGLLRITWPINGGRPYDGGYNAHLKVGPWFSQDVSMETLNFCCSILFPVELGQAFSFETSVSEHAYAVFEDGLSGASNRASVMLQFFEADGTTPVRVDEASMPTTVPEPSCWPLLGIACVGLALRSRYGRTHFQNAHSHPSRRLGSLEFHSWERSRT